MKTILGIVVLTCSTYPAFAAIGGPRALIADEMVLYARCEKHATASNPILYYDADGYQKLTYVQFNLIKSKTKDLPRYGGQFNIEFVTVAGERGYSGALVEKCSLDPLQCVDESASRWSRGQLSRLENGRYEATLEFHGPDPDWHYFSYVRFDREDCSIYPNHVPPPNDAVMDLAYFTRHDYEGNAGYGDLLFAVSRTDSPFNPFEIHLWGEPGVHPLAPFHDKFLSAGASYATWMEAGADFTVSWPPGNIADLHEREQAIDIDGDGDLDVIQLVRTDEYRGKFRVWKLVLKRTN